MRARFPNYAVATDCSQTKIPSKKTATGKLKAVTQPTTPSGCHNSCSLWSGLSLGMVSP